MSPSAYDALPGRYLLLGLIIAVFVALFYLGFFLNKRSNWRTCSRLVEAAFATSICLTSLGILAGGIILPAASPWVELPVAQMPGWSQHHAQVAGTVTRSQIPTKYGRHGTAIEHGPQDSITTTERQRVIIRTGAVFLDGDSISYACQPRGEAKTNTKPQCYEASFTKTYTYPHSRSWAWWLVPALIVLGMLPWLLTWYVVRRFGPPRPPATEQASTTTAVAVAA